MGAIRAYRVFGAQAALFALLVQFTVAFGHVHTGNAHAGTLAPTAAAALGAIQDELIVPADKSQEPADGACDICATIQLTGSAHVAVAPTLPLPVTYDVTRQPLTSQTASDDPRCFEQRSRGPPQA